LAEIKKYYWLKLQKDFFKRHDIRIIEAMPNGKDYILFYLKLLVESITHEGHLRFSDTIPYNAEMLSTITSTNIDVANSAIKIFTQLELMDICDDGTIFMNEVQKMVGAETDWAIKKRDYRLKLEDNDRTKKDNVRQEKEKEKEKEKDINTIVGNKFPDDSNEISISNYLLLKILNNNENFKKPNIQSWASHVDKMIRLDKRSIDDITSIIDFATADDFWKSNILSTAKLRDKFDTLFIQSKKMPVKQKPKSNNFTNYDQRDYDYEAIERKAMQDRISKHNQGG